MTEWKARGQLRYPDYLRIPDLLGLQRPVSVPPHHDETLFIIVHQAFELWFKLLLHSLDGLGRSMDDDDPRTALKLARRAGVILNSVTQQISILETMTALDFLEFRAGLEGASGFQSAQFREIEAVLGLADRDRVPVALEGVGRGREAYYAPLLPEERARIERRLAEASLEERFLALVVRRICPQQPGRAYLDDLPDLLEERAGSACEVLDAVAPLVEVADQQRLAAATALLERLPLWLKLDPGEREELLLAARRGQLVATLRRRGRLDEQAPESTDLRLLDEDLRRAASVPVPDLEQALRAASFSTVEQERIQTRLQRRNGLREVYRRGAHAETAGAAYQLWQLAEALLDQAQALSCYRFRHVQMVERMIGKRRGTGGSPGAAYLEKTLAYRSFPEILRVRTHL